MPRIRDILARRSDLSTFVVHLTRDTEQSAQANLECILREGRIAARTAFGPAVKDLERAGLRDCCACQATVCFTETPLEHLHLLLEPIEDLTRSCQFEPYAIALTKRLAREHGVNPVWYTDITPSGRDWLMKSVNQLIQEAITDVVKRRHAGDAEAHFQRYPISRLAPFIEQMGTGDGYRKEFWWEREWRHRGDFALPDRFLVVAPEAQHEHFARVLDESYRVPPVLIAANWGLEEIIGRLAGFSETQVGPF